MKTWRSNARRTPSIRRSIGASLWVWLISASSAHACTVCFGSSDDPIVKGVEMSVLLMIVLTYSLIVGGGVAFFVLRHRSRKRQLSAGPRSAGPHSAGPRPASPSMATPDGRS